MRRLLRGVLILVLAAGGCSDDSGPTEFDTGSNDPNVVVAFGDSISDGYDSSNGLGYRDDLQSLFAADGRTGIVVLDEGIPGTFSDSGAARIGGVLARDRPAVLILLYGTNDELISLPQAVFASFTGTTSGNLRQIIAAARANKTIVVLSTIPPVCTERRTLQRSNIVTLNEKIRSLASEFRATDEGVFLADAYDAFIQTAPPDGCGLINVATGKGNHPTEEGYALLARTYYEAIYDVRW